MQPRKIFGSTTSDTPDLEQMVSEAQTKIPSAQETQTEQSQGLDGIVGNLIGRGQSLSGATPEIPGLGSLASNQSVGNYLGSAPPEISDMLGTGTGALSESIPGLGQALPEAVQEQTEAPSPVAAALEQIAPAPEQEEGAPQQGLLGGLFSRAGGMFSRLFGR